MVVDERGVTDMERNTFAQLETVREIYFKATTDEARIYQVSNAIALYAGLRGFLLAKIECRNAGSSRASSSTTTTTDTTQGQQ